MPALYSISQFNSHTPKKISLENLNVQKEVDLLVSLTVPGKCEDLAVSADHSFNVAYFGDLKATEYTTIIAELGLEHLAGASFYHIADAECAKKFNIEKTPALLVTST